MPCGGARLTSDRRTRCATCEEEGEEGSARPRRLSGERPPSCGWTSGIHGDRPSASPGPHRLRRRRGNLDFRFKVRFRLERAGDQTTLLRLREQTLRLVLVGSRRHTERCTDDKCGELGDAIHPVYGAHDRALEGCPRQPGHPCHRAKGEHEAVRHRGDEQSLWRPSIARTTELGRRSGAQRGKPLALEGDVSLDVGDCRDGIPMRKVLHEASLRLSLSGYPARSNEPHYTAARPPRPERDPQRSCGFDNEALTGGSSYRTLRRSASKSSNSVNG